MEAARTVDDGVGRDVAQQDLVRLVPAPRLEQVPRLVVTPPLVLRASRLHQSTETNT